MAIPLGNTREESNIFGLDVSNNESLGSDMLSMNKEGLNFWLSEFVQEVGDKDSKSYPEKTIYQLICRIKRHYKENGRAEMNPLNKRNYK